MSPLLMLELFRIEHQAVIPLVPIWKGPKTCQYRENVNVGNDAS